MDQGSWRAPRTVQNKKALRCNPSVLEECERAKTLQEKHSHLCTIVVYAVELCACARSRVSGGSYKIRFLREQTTYRVVISDSFLCNDRN